MASLETDSLRPSNNRSNKSYKAHYYDCLFGDSLEERIAVVVVGVSVCFCRAGIVDEREGTQNTSFRLVEVSLSLVLSPYKSPFVVRLKFSSSKRLLLPKLCLSNSTSMVGNMKNKSN